RSSLSIGGSSADRGRRSPTRGRRRLKATAHAPPAGFDRCLTHSGRIESETLTGSRPSHTFDVRSGDMSEPTIVTKKWTRAEYDRLAEAEILGPDDHVELLGGEIVLKEPQYSPHATGIELAARALRRAFGDGWNVRTQLPIALDD